MDKTYLNWLFSIYWELFHPTRPATWWNITQNLIRIFGNQWFSVLPVWIFVVCGELVVLYFKRIESNLEQLNLSAQNMGGYFDKPANHQQTFAILLSLKQLYFAADLLHLRFGIMLISNCILCFVTMLTSSYYVIEYMLDKFVVVTCWDGSDVLDSFIRFWLICHTADRMRGAVRVITITRSRA